MLDDILEKDKLWSELDEVGVVTGNSGHEEVLIRYGVKKRKAERGTAGSGFYEMQ